MPEAFTTTFCHFMTIYYHFMVKGPAGESTDNTMQVEAVNISVDLWHQSSITFGAIIFPEW